MRVMRWPAGAWMNNLTGIAVHGTVHPDFKAVKAAFEQNFAERDELGGACCVYHKGEKVVDLWGGTRDLASGDPWEEDTMVIVFSLTKGMSAMTLRWRTPADGSTMMRVSPTTGRNSRKTANSP